MKKILLSIIIFSFSFAGTFYVETGPAPQFSINDGQAVDFDKGGLNIGYNHGFFQKGKWSVAIGGSYTLNPATTARVGVPRGFNSSWGEAGFLSIYLLPMYQIGEKFSAWASIGINQGLYDLDDFDNGNNTGFGIHIKLTDRCGVGAGFITNENRYSTDNPDDDFDVVGDYSFTRTSIFLTTNF